MGISLPRCFVRLVSYRRRVGRSIWRRGRLGRKDDVLILGNLEEDIIPDVDIYSCNQH